MIKYFTIEDLLKHYLQKKFHILVSCIKQLHYKNSEQILLIIDSVRSLLYLFLFCFYFNNSDYLKKAQKYGQITG